MANKMNTLNKSIVMGNQNLVSTSNRTNLLNTNSSLGMKFQQTRGQIRKEEQIRFTQLEQDMMQMMRRQDKLKANQQRARRLSYQAGVNADEVLLSLQLGSKERDDGLVRQASTGSIKKSRIKSVYFPSVSARSPYVERESSSVAHSTFITKKKKPEYVENNPDNMPLEMLPPIMLPPIQVTNTRGVMAGATGKNSDYLSPKAVPRTRRKSTVVVPQYLPSVPKRFERNEKFKKKLSGKDIKMENLKYCRYLRPRKPRRQTNKTII